MTEASAYIADPLGPSIGNLHDCGKDFQPVIAFENEDINFHTVCMYADKSVSGRLLVISF